MAAVALTVKLAEEIGGVRPPRLAGLGVALLLSPVLIKRDRVGKAPGRLFRCSRPEASAHAKLIAVSGLIPRGLVRQATAVTRPYLEVLA
jgi:hypothetical protein